MNGIYITIEEFKGTDELDYVGYTDMEVQDETGFIHEIRD